MSKGKVFVMMSGGVDSSVAVAKLVDQGYDVRGVFMRCWSLKQLENLGVSSDLYGCFWEDDAQDAQLVAKKLGIPFEIWDFEDVYRQKVVEYMLHEYRIGKTPNPDVMCNSTVKFGVFYQRAIELGADFVATGHYARVVNNIELSDLPIIARGKDENKDQSYFLWGVKTFQISKILFPVGEFETKSEVRAFAEEKDLITAKKPDSQGLCFIGQTPLRELLLQTLGKKQGNIVDLDGKVLGLHEGAYLYTIGQREKLGLSGGPWFVAEIKIDTNEVVVAHQHQQQSIFSQSCNVKNVNWQVEFDRLLESGLEIQAQIRYRQTPEKCKIIVEGENLKVEFENPIRAVSKGQSIVFYSDDLMLGGGVID
jgi:tRNA-specific 2-thiouridylase